MKNNCTILIIALAFGVISGCNQSTKNSDDTGFSSADAETLHMLRQAYEFGFPLMVMQATQRAMTNIEKAQNKGRVAAPYNQLVSAVEFPDDKFRDVVRPNNDTYYSMACLDLRGEPLVLQLPDTKGRYYLFPMLDAWTNVFFSPGKRTTGTQEQIYLISGPGWNGEIPKGMQQVKSPTDMVWIIGRIQVNNAADGATVVKKIQDGCKLVPLSSYGKPFTPPAGNVDPTLPRMSPNDMVTGMPIQDYFNELNKLMISNPPAAVDSAFIKRAAQFGVSPGASFDTTRFSKALLDSIKNIPAWGKKDMIQNGFTSAKPVNGWAVHHGLGDYGTNYSFRAGVAYGGLGANLDADAIYPVSMIDADGETYNGSKNNYVLHFDPDKLPPTNAFWSLTMYDSEGFLCANPINRFAIGDRNPLKKNTDGSLDIIMQKDNPGKDKENNWLPAPNGPFNLLLRVYWPKEEMVNGGWQAPAVQKVK